jgi:hypothetical protein
MTSLCHGAITGVSVEYRIDPECRIEIQNSNLGGAFQLKRVRLESKQNEQHTYLLDVLRNVLALCSP